MKNKTLVIIIAVLSALILIGSGCIVAILVVRNSDNKQTDVSATAEETTVTETVAEETEEENDPVADTTAEQTTETTTESVDEITPESFIGSWHMEGIAAEDPTGVHAEFTMVDGYLRVVFAMNSTNGGHVAENQDYIYVAPSEITDGTFNVHIDEDGWGNSADVEFRCYYNPSAGENVLDVTVYNVVDKGTVDMQMWGFYESSHTLYK